MAEQDCSSDGTLEFEQSSKLSSVDPSESKTTTATQAFDFSDQNVQLNALESTRLHCDHLKSPVLVDLDYYDPTEPPPLDWKSDSSSESGSVVELESSSTVGECEASGSFNLDVGEEAASGIQDCSKTPDKNEEVLDQETHLKIPEICDFPKLIEPLEREKICAEEKEKKHRIQEREENRPHDIDHSHIQSLLNQLHFFHPPSPDELNNHSSPPHSHLTEFAGPSHQNLDLAGQSVWSEPETSSALLFSHEYQKDLLQLLEDPQLEEPNHTRVARSSLVAIEAHAELKTQADQVDEMFSVTQEEDVWHRRSPDELLLSRVDSEDQWTDAGAFIPDQSGLSNSDLQEAEKPAYKSVPGPCDPDDLLDGVIFGAKYLGSTQLQSEKNPSTNARMAQAQEAVHRIKAPEGESQPMTQVDLFISTQRIKVLSADTQEAMMDHALQMISYIADIEKIVVLMARRKPAARKASDTTAGSTAPPKKCWMICHVFSSDDAQIIAQAIGQAFSVAYQQFLYANGIKSSDLKPGEYSDYLGAQELYNGDLVHFSCSENIREVSITKKAGDILGLAIVESGWGSILPTVVVANLLHGGPAERSGELSIGDRIMSVNGTSLVGLPITTCQSIIRDLKSLSMIKLSIVHCPPVTLAIIRRPDPKYQLGFSVEDGIICSLMRGGIAERGGIRVGHRIIEINGQSVVATPHDKIIHILSNAVGEIHLKTMPTSTYRLLTGIDQPVYL